MNPSPPDDLAGCSPETRALIQRGRALRRETERTIEESHRILAALAENYQLLERRRAASDAAWLNWTAAQSPR